MYIYNNYSYPYKYIHITHNITLTIVLISMYRIVSNCSRSLFLSSNFSPWPLNKTSHLYVTDHNSKQCGKYISFYS